MMVACIQTFSDTKVIFSRKTSQTADSGRNATSSPATQISRLLLLCWKYTAAAQPSLTPCIVLIKVLLNLKQMDFVLHYLDFSTFNTIEYDTCDAFIGLAMSVSVTEEPIDYRKRCWFPIWIMFRLLTGLSFFELWNIFSPVCKIYFPWRSTLVAGTWSETHEIGTW